MTNQLKIISWNINGLQGILSKITSDNAGRSVIIKKRKPVIGNILDSMIKTENPDILCLQEIRCSTKFDHIPYLPSLSGYYIYTNYSSVGKGYSGTLIASRYKPSSVHYNFPDDIADHCNTSFGQESTLNSEGRLIALQFKEFTILNLYSPNSKPDLARLKERINWWDIALQLWIEQLKENDKEQSGNDSNNLNDQDKKGKNEMDENKTGKDELKDQRNLIVVGDMNIIPTELDEHKPIYSAGASEEERKSFKQLLESQNMVDSFRHLNPTTRKWSWSYPWTHKYGCRLDMALVNKEMISNVTKSDILDYKGSDHLPLILTATD